MNKLLTTIMLGLLILIVSTTMASAAHDYTTNFFYQGQPVNGVRAINFVATSMQGQTLGTRLSDATSGTNSVMISYPYPSPTIYGYASYWFSPGFRAKEMLWRPAQDGSSSIDVNWTKYNGNSAVINSVNVPSSVNEGQALQITIQVRSPISEVLSAPYAEPSDADLVRDYFSGLTNVTIEIRDSGNNVVYTETQQDYILHDTTRTFIFSWIPNYNQAGTYSVVVLTNVPDSKVINAQQGTSTTSGIIVNDIEAPAYSNLVENPNDPATYAPNQTYTFNATWTDNDGISSVWIVWNGTTYTPAQNGNVYTFTRRDLSAGAYNYVWYANDTNEYTNSVAGTYTINKAIPGLSLSISPDTTVDEETETTAIGSGCPAGLTCTLYRNSVAVSNPDIATLGAGTYYYVYNTTGNENYTSASASKTLVVSTSTSGGSGNTYIISSTSLASGYSRWLSLNDVLKFEICGEPYYLKLTDVDDDEATLKITPRLIIHSFEEDDSEEFDLNGDGVRDIIVKVLDIDDDNEKAKVYIRKISSICPITEINETETETITLNEEGIEKPQKSNLWYIITALIISIILASTAIWLMKSNKPRKKVVVG